MANCKRIYVDKFNEMLQNIVYSRLGISIFDGDGCAMYAQACDDHGYHFFRVYEIEI